MNVHNLTVYVALCLCFTACGEGRHPAWDRERRTIGPLAVQSQVAYVDTARDRVILIETASETPTTRSVSIGRNAIFAQPTRDEKHLAVLTQGQEATKKGQRDEEPMFWLVDLKSHRVARQYPIGSPFDRLAVASNSSSAIAYYSAGGVDESTGVFRNPNELAIMDLSRDASDGKSTAPNPVLKTVRSFGAAPLGIVLSPPMIVPGAEDESPRVFAFVLGRDEITILDVSHPERREVTLRLNAGSESVIPRELVFAPKTGTTYVRSDNATDVLAIVLSGEGPKDETDNDYQPTLVELGTGAGPSDIAVFDDAEENRFVLAAIPGRRQVALIDGDTAAFTTIATPDPIDRILLFPDADGQPPRFAVLAAISARVPRLHVLDLDGLSNELVPLNLRTVNLSEPVLDVISVGTSGNRAMIVHDADRTILGLLDVSLGAVSPLEGLGRLQAYDFSDDGAYLLGITQGIYRAGFLDLKTLHPSDMRLDDPPMDILSLSKGAVFIHHADPIGRATIIPNVHGASRKTSVVLSGFLLDSYLSDNY